MLAECPAQRAQWTQAAQKLWNEFYEEWETRERKGLLRAALKRAHVYVRKLAMAYAATEGTLPQEPAPDPFEVQSLFRR